MGRYTPHHWNCKQARQQMPPFARAALVVMPLHSNTTVNWGHILKWNSSRMRSMCKYRFLSLYIFKWNKKFLKLNLKMPIPRVVRNFWKTDMYVPGGGAKCYDAHGTVWHCLLHQMSSFGREAVRREEDTCLSNHMSPVKHRHSGVANGKPKMPSHSAFLLW